MFFVSSNVLVLFIYPLSLSFFLLMAAIVLSYFRKKLFRVFLLCGLIILYIFSIRPTSDFLLRPLERKYVVDKDGTFSADAIVVLEGPGNRHIKGVSLFYKKAAPLIMSGGEGAITMAEFALEFGVPANKIITEKESRNARENALYTKQILNKINAKKIILITSAYHMPRAYVVFKKIGVDVMPVAADFIVTDKPYNLFSFIPNVDDLRHSTFAIKEYVGIIVYWLRGWI